MRYAVRKGVTAAAANTYWRRRFSICLRANGGDFFSKKNESPRLSDSSLLGQIL